MKKRKIISLTKEYLDTVFVVLSFSFSFLSLITIVLKKNNLSSVFFKVTFIFFGLWVLYKAWFLLFTRNGRMICKQNLSLITCLLLAIVSLLVSFFSSLPAFSIGSLTSGLQFTNLVILVFSLLAVFIINTSNIKKIAIGLLSLESILFTFVVLISFLTGTSRTWMGLVSFEQLTLNFSNSNLAGIVLATLMCINFYSFFAFRDKVLKILSIVAFVFSLFFLWLTSSRTPFISIAVAVIIILLRFFDKKGNFNISVSTFSVVFPLLFIAFYFFLFRGTLSHGITGGTGAFGGKETGSRLFIWAESLSYYSSSIKRIFLGDCFVLTGNFHNSILTLLCTYGLIPTFFILAFLIICLSHLFSNNEVKTKTQWIGNVVLLTFLLFGISEGTPAVSSNGMYLIFIMAIVMSKTRLSSCVFFEKYPVKKSSQADVLIITNVYNYGSIGKIVRDCHEYNINNGYKSYVIVGRRCEENSNNVCCIENLLEVLLSKILRKLFKSEHIGNYFMTREIIYSIKSLNPKIIHITALNDDFVNYKKLLEYIAKKEIKVVYTHHSEYFYLGGCGGHAYDCVLYKSDECRKCPISENNKSSKIFLLKKGLIKSLKNNIVTTSVSPWLHHRAVKSCIFKGIKDYVVMNGSSIKKPSQDFNRDLFLNSYNIDSNKTIVLHITPSMLNPTKKFNDVIKIAKINPSLQFVVLTLKNDKSYSIPNNMMIIENVIEQNELAKFYFSCDITLLTGTIETFSMPVIESMLCGTPVVGYKCGGPESVALDDYSLFTENGDYLSLSNAMNNMLNMNHDKNLLAEKASKTYDSHIMARNYCNIYSEMIGSELASFYEVSI